MTFIQYVAENSENNLKLSVYSDELVAKYQRKNKKGGFLFLIAGIVSTVASII
ncbi:hypothetical protein [Liquorilactobacillus uvarum]|uniref:hypothetical protein n=1 Tax=Liquorilactobacillus uvarum TaxID=303240 RepID=UPI00288BAB7E|nr:hypothetical protein [Liquorilactobacillus uvarum]